MLARDFCFWLQGFFEIHKAESNTNYQNDLCSKQVDMIERHLALVFEHDIDPQLDGENAAKKKLYQNIHDGDLPTKTNLIRC